MIPISLTFGKAEQEVPPCPLPMHFKIRYTVSVIWFAGGVLWRFMGHVLSVSPLSAWLPTALHQPESEAVPDPGEAPAAVAEMCISPATRPMYLTLCPLPTLLATPPQSPSSITFSQSYLSSRVIMGQPVLLGSHCN